MIDLTPAEEKILKIINDVNLAKKADIERHMLNNGIKNVDINEFVANAIEGLMRKNLITKIHPIGITCYVITRHGSSVMMFLNGKQNNNLKSL